MGISNISIYGKSKNKYTFILFVCVALLSLRTKEEQRRLKHNKAFEQAWRTRRE